MYGQTSKIGLAAASGAALPFTGLEVGQWVFAAVTLILVGIALLQLVRPAPAHRP